MILAIRTDGPHAYLALINEDKIVAEYKWAADRTLSDKILQKIDSLLFEARVEKHDIKGLIVFKGPGSFTSLRIGVSVANAFAYALEVPVVGAQGNNWQNDGMAKLESANQQDFVTVEYGAEPNITKPRK